MNVAIFALLVAMVLVAFAPTRADGADDADDEDETPEVVAWRYSPGEQVWHLLDESGDLVRAIEQAIDFSTGRLAEHPDIPAHVRVCVERDLCFGALRTAVDRLGEYQSGEDE